MTASADTPDTRSPLPTSDSVPPLSAVARPSRARRAPVVAVVIMLGFVAAIAGWQIDRTSPGPPVPVPVPVPVPGSRGNGNGPNHSRIALGDSEPDASSSEDDVEPDTLPEQRRRLHARMRRELGLSDEALRQVAAIFDASPDLGQGNPAITRHPMTRSECRGIRAEAGLDEAPDPACGAPHMASLFDPARPETAAGAAVCIDRFEFPGIPCEYPVVHVRASEAALLCRAVGKRICDAHEWEGACAGAVREPAVDYRFGWRRVEGASYHNTLREIVWSYGPDQDHALCATGSERTRGCSGGGYSRCGSNTYPAGAFPECKSAFGVFDLHGNAAEHMNVPTKPEEMARSGDGGFTEMKGSWFVFQSMDVHPDDCRWREPGWHETRLQSEASHKNYHLGFRCCKDVERP